MKGIYHVHTRWCRHATGEIEDYIKAGIEAGLEEMAITEHVPHEDNYDVRRMSWDEFEDYNKELDFMIEKYKDKIKVIKGFECEYYPQCMDTYKMFKEKYNYKVIVLGHHMSKDRRYDNFGPKDSDAVEVYGNEVSEALRTGFFNFIAHPDVVLCSYTKGFDDVAKEALSKIFKTCEELDIPVEYNINGIRDEREYPSMEVFEFSKNYKLRYLVNSDAHNPEDLCDDLVLSREKLLKEKNFNLIEKLVIK